LRDHDRSEARRRATSFLLTVLAHLLLLLLLIRLAPPHFGSSKAGSKLITFSVAPEAQEEAAHSKSPAKTHAAKSVAQPPAAPPPPTIKLPTTAAPWVLTPGLERFDVRQVAPAPHAEQQSDASASDDASGASNSDKPVAYGPAGQPLYDAAWYREPTHAELAYYLKDARPGPGFGMIACQTVARYHVDNCVELGESLGSGLARAVREAAWQFLVLPPRVGGRAMVGTWVRIRIDYTEQKAP
jgi:protein TonB